MEDDLFYLLLNCNITACLSFDLPVEFALYHFEGLLYLDFDVLLRFNQGVMNE